MTYFLFFLLTSGWGGIFQRGLTCNKDLNYKTCSLTSYCASREIFTWYWCEEHSHEFHVKFFTWISCERDFPLKLCENHVSFHMNFTWIYFTWIHFTRIPRDFRMKPHVKIIWNSFHVRHNWLCCALKNIKLCRMVNLKRYPYYLDVHPVFKYNNVRISW